jgi:pimeloyl-ACP methyl ester carboxylesterase
LRAGATWTADSGAADDDRPAWAALERLVERFDASIFDVGRRRARIRVEAGEEPVGDVLIEYGQARLVAPETRRPDAILSADPSAWESAARDGGLSAFRAGHIRIRHDLHLGVGFLAATAPVSALSGLRIHHVRTAIGRMSVVEAGRGDPVILIHGLGATKASFLPTVGALARSHRAIAIDLPGFGDSVKPIGAAYDAAFFADAIAALLDAMEFERAHLVGNSMGGRVAIEAGLRHPDRVGRLALLAPSLAWLRSRPWAPLLRIVPTELGLIQPAPRAVVERIVRRVVPAGQDQWTAAGVDEFLRAYLTPRGRAAFYAAARNIYLEEPHGPDGFWTRLGDLQAPSLFVWGRRDTLVPIGFARHVHDALPGAQHLELDCGHVPQLERPRETHAAMLRFLDAV